MTDARTLIDLVERAGGRFVVDGERLGVFPKMAGEQLAAELKANKAAIIVAILERDASLWHQPFQQWLSTACVPRPRDCTNLNALYVSFVTWAGEQNCSLCGRDAFEWLLAEDDFLVADVCGTRLVSGVMLKDDVLACERFQQETLQ